MRLAERHIVKRMLEAIQDWKEIPPRKLPKGVGSTRTEMAFVGYDRSAYLTYDSGDTKENDRGYEFELWKIWIFNPMPLQRFPYQVYDVVKVPPGSPPRAIIAKSDAAPGFKYAMIPAGAA